MLALYRLEKFMKDNAGRANVEILSTLGDAWYVDIEYEGGGDEYIAFGDYFDSLEEGINECINRVETRFNVRRGFK